MTIKTITNGNFTLNKPSITNVGKTYQLKMVFDGDNDLDGVTVTQNMKYVKTTPKIYDISDITISEGDDIPLKCSFLYLDRLNNNSRVYIADNYTFTVYYKPLTSGSYNELGKVHNNGTNTKFNINTNLTNSLSEGSYQCRINSNSSNMFEDGVSWFKLYIQK